MAYTKTLKTNAGHDNQGANNRHTITRHRYLPIPCTKTPKIFLQFSFWQYQGVGGYSKTQHKFL